MKTFVEVRGFEYDSHDAQLFDVEYIVESPEEYPGQNTNQYESWGYGCCYNCASDHLAQMLRIPEELLQAIAEKLGNGKIIAGRTLGRYADGFVADESNTKLRLTGAAQEAEEAIKGWKQVQLP